ncbi:hypothetical protein NE237_009353 [Protea cynaroides]|uniref:Uncharacterized protein n=1 Tax=Protea cynaroides TaxID=273540 RepID=A0A9Q0KXD6_9MAGN|nr:hypothetical protein NE237_009353 [Protea cynaroides]
MFVSKGRGDTWSLSKVLCSGSPSSSIFKTLLETSMKKVGLGFALTKAHQNFQTPNPNSYGDSQLVVRQVTGVYKAQWKCLSEYLTQVHLLRRAPTEVVSNNHLVGLGFALTEAPQNSQTPNPDSYGDSQLVVRQVTGVYEARRKHLSENLTQVVSSNHMSLRESQQILVHDRIGSHNTEVDNNAQMRADAARQEKDEI